MVKNGNGEGPGVGHNSQTLREQGKSFVERIERVNRDIELEQEAAKEAITGHRADIKAILKAAKSAGLKGAVQAAVAARRLQRKADAVRERLDIADRDTFDTIRLALGDLADTALGKAALAEAPATATQATA